MFWGDVLSTKSCHTEKPQLMAGKTKAQSTAKNSVREQKDKTLEENDLDHHKWFGNLLNEYVTHTQKALKISRGGGSWMAQWLNG